MRAVRMISAISRTISGCSSATLRSSWISVERSYRLDGTLRIFADVQPDALPVACPDCGLAAVFVEFPIKIFVFPLSFFAEQRREHRNAVHVCGNLRACHVGEGGKHVPECRYEVRPRPFGDQTGTPGDHRHADSSFVHVALDAAQRAVAAEEVGIGAAFTVRSVVAREDDDRPFAQTEAVDQAPSPRPHIGPDA